MQEDKDQGTKRLRPALWRAMESERAAKKRLEHARSLQKMLDVQGLKKMVDAQCAEFLVDLELAENAKLLEERGFAFGFNKKAKPMGAKTIKFIFPVSLRSTNTAYNKGRDVEDGATIDWSDDDYDDADCWDIARPYRDTILKDLCLKAYTYDELQCKTDVEIDGGWQFGDHDSAATAAGYCHLQMFVRPWSLSPLDEPVECKCYGHDDGMYMGILRQERGEIDASGTVACKVALCADDRTDTWLSWADFIKESGDAALSPRPPLETAA